MNKKNKIKLKLAQKHFDQASAWYVFEKLSSAQEEKVEIVIVNPIIGQMANVVITKMPDEVLECNDKRVSCKLLKISYPDYSMLPAQLYYISSDHDKLLYKMIVGNQIMELRNE